MTTKLCKFFCIVIFLRKLQLGRHVPSITQSLAAACNNKILAIFAVICYSALLVSGTDLSSEVEGTADTLISCGWFSFPVSGWASTCLLATGSVHCLLADSAGPPTLFPVQSTWDQDVQYLPYAESLKWIDRARSWNSVIWTPGSIGSNHAFQYQWLLLKFFQISILYTHTLSCNRPAVYCDSKERLLEVVAMRNSWGGASVEG